MALQGVLDSALGCYLLEQWAWGHMAAVQVQVIAALAVQDGANLPMLRKLAKLGKAGKMQGNVHRDLVRGMDLHTRLCPATVVQLPLVKAKGMDLHLHDLDHHMLLPHVMFHALHTKFPAVFQVRVRSMPCTRSFLPCSGPSARPAWSMPPLLGAC
jgi:hypothetical protein